ncbi:MAG TPA: bifunctional UDP-N-acetylglucosamine diphosphorylase/glucosamine-1-phosphate N-acetyltransferase GlmU [Methylococcaceae bacterium]|nr:bifunctional UDP-N-acetylglucosamine diphosphorylase/glucosamine-1-phosphate N-acetyltransferase GlmU [Methylococcaceae bacterium]
MAVQSIILAAGQGKRMFSDLPKVLHRIGPCSLLEHAWRVAAAVSEAKPIIVIGHGAEQVQKTLGHLPTGWVMQERQLGTGHAVQQAMPGVDPQDIALILYGDVPLLRAETLRELTAIAAAGRFALLTVELDDPAGYGRIVRGTDGRVVRIVEEKDAAPEEQRIREINTGIMAVGAESLNGWLAQLDNRNSQGEYYLTDVIELAVRDGLTVQTVFAPYELDVAGVNDRAQLARLERAYQARMAADLMARGVTLRDPARLDVRGEVELLGRDIEVDVDVIFEGWVRLGGGVKIGAHSIIRDAEIGEGAEILSHCVIENAVIGAGSRVGPFARLRPDTNLAEGVHIGNFVEIKKSQVGPGSKINHLSYVGDCTVGSGVNVGAGTITCNYDGVNKHRTVIEDGAFIGSNTQLVAPVRVGKNATIGAGSTVTKDAPPDTLTLSRARQVSVDGWKRPQKPSPQPSPEPSPRPLPEGEGVSRFGRGGTEGE